MILLLGGLGALVFTQTSYFTEEGIKAGIAQVQAKYRELTGRFIEHQTHDTSSSVLFEIGKTHGDILEVASPTTIQEEFSRSDTKLAAWGWVNLGTTITEIKVPATYRFHVKLSEMEQISKANGVLSVRVPKIHPTLPVAFDSQKVERKSSADWLRFDSAEQLQALEKNITPALGARAEGKLKLVQETVRQDTQRFLETWLAAQPQQEIRSARVYFEGEEVSSEAAVPTP